MEKISYFNGINDSLIRIAKIIRKKIKTDSKEEAIVKRDIEEIMKMVREIEESGVLDTFEEKEKYFVAKTIGRLEAIYSIIYPNGKNE